MTSQKNPALFTSTTDQWTTPQNLFDSIQEEYGLFDLDAAADEYNSKAPNFISKENDSLKTPWLHDNVWLNPPYGRTLLHWAEKCIQEIKHGQPHQIVILIPARTDTRWFNLLASQSSEIHFFKGRIKFGHGLSSAPFPSALIVLKSVDKSPIIVSFGKVVP